MQAAHTMEMCVLKLQILVHGKEESECIAEMDHVFYLYMGEKSICLVIDDFDPSLETPTPGGKAIK